MNDVRELNAALLEAAEQEQLLLAEDLHDTLCPSLVGISLLLKVAQRRSEMGKKVEAADLQKINDYLEEAIEYSRLPFQVQAMAQPGNGLGKALAALAHITGKRTTCHFSGDEEVELRDPRAASVLYRIARAAIRSAMREAQAMEITISLRQDGTGIKLEICAESCQTVAASTKALKNNALLGRYVDAVGLTLNVEAKSKSAFCVVGCLSR